MSMTVKEAIQYIENHGKQSVRPGIGRTRELAHRLGDPQKQLKFVHITGTNGKGSTACMVESILRKAGYCTGLFTSPHLLRFNERIRVNGEEISDEDLILITEKVAGEADQMSEQPKFFELATVIAFMYFLQKNCDIVVMEVGMGGEFDPTNVIDAPEVAVITNIGLEHTEYLGDTVEKIAQTKAGIIKPGCNVVCYPLESQALSVIEEVCAREHVPLCVADPEAIQEVSDSLMGQEFIYRDDTYELSLAGKFQQFNAAVALETVRALESRGWEISFWAVNDGLASAVWPARFELLSGDPLVILDGGHNLQCAQALAENIDRLLKGYRLTFLVGMLQDKDYARVIELLGPKAARFICLAPDSPRALSSERLKEFIQERGFEASSCESIGEGIVTALMAESSDRLEGFDHTAVIMFGSLYLAGALGEAFRYLCVGRRGFRQKPEA